MGDPPLDSVVDEAVADESVRKVKIEVTHKHESNKSSTTWTIALVVVLVLAGAVVYAADSVKEIAGSGGGDGGNCGDGVDNDGGGQADRDDPDCYENPELWKGYNPDKRETSPGNDGPGRP